MSAIVANSSSHIPKLIGAHSLASSLSLPDSALDHVRTGPALGVGTDHLEELQGEHTRGGSLPDD